jgi:predicted esterase
MQTLRILCLHGYHGNAEVLRDQMAILTDGMDCLAEFVRVNAPSLANADFGWWHAIRGEKSPHNEDPGVGPGAARYEGWSRTCKWVVSLFEREGPFDGVFGFSQGAALTALLVGLRSHGGTTTEHKPLAFDFAIMVGGFLANDPDLARLYDSHESYDLPSIHIIGRSDFIVPSEYSRKVAAKFKNPLVLEHDGGHVIAGTPLIRKRVASFLEERMRRR